MTIRTRFAPSPTGNLHIGGVRTALYAWLYAKKYQGEFILRIEDTDSARSTHKDSQTILEALKWLQLDYTKDPFFQSKRLDKYTAACDYLLQHNLAYKCNCSTVRLETLRHNQLKNKQQPKYDRHCLTKQESITSNYVVRFKTPDNGKVVFTDLIFGHITIDNNQLDDLIILRSDKIPTYHLAVVVDDIDMQISHVIRGDDHLHNTARHINITAALNKEAPIYAHLPMVLGNDGQKLSKRNAITSVLEYRRQGYIPDALLNTLVRLGWSHGNQEIFSRSEMIEYFDLSHVQKSPAKFDIDKLKALNKKHMVSSVHATLINELKWHFKQLNLDISGGTSLNAMLELQHNKHNNLADLAYSCYYFYHPLHLTDFDIEKSYLQDIQGPLVSLLNKLTALTNWQLKNIKQSIKDILNQYELSFAQLGKPLRIILTGDKNHADLSLSILHLGQDIATHRIQNALEFIK